MSVEIEISKNSLSNRRQFVRNMRTLLDFSEADCLSRVTLDEALDHASIEPLAPDLVSEGTHALRLHALGGAEGAEHPHHMTFTCRLAASVDLTDRPTVVFAFSTYDGARDSRYFQEVSENKYFVEKPDPELVSRAYIRVTLVGAGKQATRTVQLTKYGFNRIYASFAGEAVLCTVEAIRFECIIDEVVPGWQRILKLDTVKAGVTVDLTFRGAGMADLFTAEQGYVTHTQDVVTFSYAPGGSLTLPDLTDAADTVCDVFLPIKNTILLRLCTDTPLSALTLSFMTDQEPFFSEDKQKRWTPAEGLPDTSHPVTVYLNLSDLPKATGRLTGLRLTPEGGQEMKLWKVAFEQEDRLQPSAGRFLSCTVEPETDRITFTCAVSPAYMGRTLEIYELFADVIHEDLSKLKKVASAVIQGETITLQASFHKPHAATTRIASEFLGVVRDADGEGYLKLERRAVITNWRDVCGENPYAFTLPMRDACVTDACFGAAGDGYTDDTDAIQTAIDWVAAQGGGRVVLPSGDGLTDRLYGRRYLVTNLRLRSFVELHLEEGVVLWQSDDLAHYKILPRFGHNVSMTGVNWPANHSSGNMPLLYAFREEQVKITGPGLIRMCDTESRSEDGYFTFIGDNVCIGCCDRMHVAPIGLVECEQFEVSDLTILRSSGVYMVLKHSCHGFVGNVRMDQAKCTGADGMWPSGGEYIRFTRIMLNNNDDGICLSACYNDPRDMLWYYDYPGMRQGTRHIELSHSRFSCYTFTASAISFCTWGTNAPVLDLMEVRDIHVYDTVLEGRVAIGGWTDNPYFGMMPFNGSETDDFSPVCDVRVHDCELRSPLGIAPLRITNFENDIDFPSPSDFEYGSFLRRPAERLPDWRLGLSNWSYGDRQTVEQVTLYGVSCACLRPLRGKACNLWQGLTLSAGTHTMHFRYKASGNFRAFVSAPDGAVLQDAVIEETECAHLPGCDWKEACFTFTVPEAGLWRVGLAEDPAHTIVVYATDFSMDHRHKGVKA